MSGASANWPLNSFELYLYTTVQLYSDVKGKILLVFIKMLKQKTEKKVCFFMFDFEINLLC